MARKTMSPVRDSALLEAALEGLELQKARIEQQIVDVRRMLGRRPAAIAKNEAVPAAQTPAKRELSPAARKRIAAAQKKRWAEYRKKTAEKA